MSYRDPFAFHPAKTWRHPSGCRHHPDLQLGEMWLTNKPVPIADDYQPHGFPLPFRRVRAFDVDDHLIDGRFMAGVAVKASDVQALVDAGHPESERLRARSSAYPHKYGTFAVLAPSETAFKEKALDEICSIRKSADRG